MKFRFVTHVSFGYLYPEVLFVPIILAVIVWVLDGPSAAFVAFWFSVPMYILYVFFGRMRRSVRIIEVANGQLRLLDRLQKQHKIHLLSHLESVHLFTRRTHRELFIGFREVDEDGDVYEDQVVLRSGFWSWNSDIPFVLSHSNLLELESLLRTRLGSS